MAKELTRKEKQITQLYIETLEDVGRNADNWISFLKRASYNYKYKFDEQILIYAQKPDAVACAETTIWNKKLKRWVNKGAKGIALITEKDGELGLRLFLMYQILIVMYMVKNRNCGEQKKDIQKI